MVDVIPGGSAKDLAVFSRDVHPGVANRFMTGFGRTVLAEGWDLP